MTPLADAGLPPLEAIALLVAVLGVLGNVAIGLAILSHLPPSRED